MQSLADMLVKHNVHERLGVHLIHGHTKVAVGNVNASAIRGMCCTDPNTVKLSGGKDSVFTLITVALLFIDFLRTCRLRCVLARCCCPFPVVSSFASLTGRGSSSILAPTNRKSLPIVSPSYWVEDAVAVDFGCCSTPGTPKGLLDSGAGPGLTSTSSDG